MPYGNESLADSITLWWYMVGSDNVPWIINWKADASLKPNLLLLFKLNFFWNLFFAVPIAAPLLPRAD